jgi:hypothetical protein
MNATPALIGSGPIGRVFVPRLSEQEKERLAELVADGVPFWRICEAIGRDRWTTRRNINYLKRPPKPEPRRSLSDHWRVSAPGSVLA